MFMKRILCLIDSLGAGGAQRQLVGLSSYLKRKGYDVIVLFYHNDLFYEDNLIGNNVPYVYLKKAERKTIRFFQIARHIREMNPDVVISYLDTPNICGCFTKLFSKQFRLIVSERNTTQNTDLKERIKFNLFRVSDYVVPNSYTQADFIRKAFPFLSEKVVAIPNYVDLDLFSPPAFKERRVVPEIMIAASIWASKNTLGFIDAVAALKNKGYCFHVSWYGKSDLNKDYINQCEDKIASLNLGDVIQLKEKIKQIRDCYRTSDYFCLPSFYEGTPNVLCEAMACGLPVVCSDVSDNGRYVGSNENGFLFNPSDINSIVNAFEKLFALSDEEYLSFCLNSRKRAEQMLSYTSFLDAYVRLIEIE